MGGGGDAAGGAGGGVGEVEVGLLLEGGVVGAEDGEEGFDVEEEVFVDFGYLGFAGGHDCMMWWYLSNGTLRRSSILGTVTYTVTNKMKPKSPERQEFSVKTSSSV